MSADFWFSSHCSRLISGKIKTEKDAHHAEDVSDFGLDVLRLLEAYNLRVIQCTGRALKIKQNIVATAMVYFKRCYSKLSLKAVHPLLAVATSVFLACKVDESPCRCQQVLAGVNKALDKLGGAKTSYNIALTPALIVSCELLLIEVLGHELIVYHPYRPLLEYIQKSRLTSCTDLAWSIVNDSYRTCVCFKFPPHLIAIAALKIAASHLGVHWRQWYRTLRVDHDEVQAVIDAFENLYETYTNPTLTSSASSSRTPAPATTSTISQSNPGIKHVVCNNTDSNDVLTKAFEKISKYFSLNTTETTETT